MKKKWRWLLDELWSKAIRLRDGKCVKCGSVRGLHAAHIFPKGSYPLLRHNLDNGLTLCYKDHYFWAHINPIEFVEFVKSFLGVEKYNKLLEESRDRTLHQLPGDKDYEKIEKILLSYIDELQTVTRGNSESNCRES